MNAVLSRRDVLSKCFGAGLLVAIPPLSSSTMLAMWELAEGRRLKPTPPNDLGPFYKSQAPLAHRLSRPDDPGLPLSVSGTVFDVNGEALPNAKLEVWQADPFGRYVAEAGEKEEIVIAQCDPALIESVRRNWPFLRDRRVDAYGPILSRYLA